MGLDHPDERTTRDRDGGAGILKRGLTGDFWVLVLFGSVD
jgi:hypothetical protein